MLTRPSTARWPISSVAPWWTPAFTPPPAIQVVKACGLWSRPVEPFWQIGSRPNSPQQITSVSIEQPAGLEVGQQRGDRPVGLAGELAVVLLDVRVAVPASLVLHAAAVDLDEPHAPLDHAAGHQALAREVGTARVVEAVEGPGGRRLRLVIERLGRGHLHPVGQLEGLDSRGQLGLAGLLFELMAVEPGEQVELGALGGVGERFAAVPGCRSAAPGRSAPCPGRRPAGSRCSSSGRDPWGARGRGCRTSRRTPGRFWFSVPRPYVTHDPTQGKPIRLMPVLIWNRAGRVVVRLV